MSNKRIQKAIKQLEKIDNPNESIQAVIDTLRDEIEPKRNAFEVIEDRTVPYAKRRDLLTDILEAGAKLSFNYEKKDGTHRVVNVEWSDDYTYDIPPENSDYIFMYDEDDDFFKHFKLDRISDIEERVA